MYIEPYRNAPTYPVADSRGGVITYVAKCLPERYSDPVDVHSEEAMLAAIMARPRKGGAAITEAFQQLNDFRVETVNPDTLSHADTARLVTLHHSIYCNEWAIHSGSRADLMNNNMNLCHREKHFLAEFRDVGMQKYAQVFQKIHECIGLDVFGIDLALVNGKTLIFEANACMSFVGKRHGTDEQYRYLTAIRRALKRMLIKACRDIPSMESAANYRRSGSREFVCD